MKKIGVFYHPMIEAARSLAERLKETLQKQGIEVWMYSAFDWEKARTTSVKCTDLVLCAGGDGTILRAAQAVADESVPITGINLGKLGFLNELTIDEVDAALPDILQGKGWIDERSMLHADLTNPDGATAAFDALNDVVVARGAVSRIIHIEAQIDNEPLTIYRADGVILASATGSTGYNLSAGGAILHPQSRDFQLLPILPHLSLPYPLVLQAESQVRLVVNTPHEATLSVDGHMNTCLASGSVVVVKQSHKRARFLRLHEPAFYGNLERKLKVRRNG
jgi:NAD+ kinase